MESEQTEGSTSKWILNWSFGYFWPLFNRKKSLSAKIGFNITYNREFSNKIHIIYENFTLWVKLNGKYLLEIITRNLKAKIFRNYFDLFKKPD